MAALIESTVEEAALGWLESLGRQVKHGPDISPAGETLTLSLSKRERERYGEVVLGRRLRDALAQLNPDLLAEALGDALWKLTWREGVDLVQRNRGFQRMLVHDITVENRSLMEPLLPALIWQMSPAQGPQPGESFSRHRIKISISRLPTLQLAGSKSYNEPMIATDFYPRFAADRLTEALQDFPAVLIHGPRQSGKTTLAQRVGTRAGYAYFSFDEEAVKSVAMADPIGFVADLPPRVILDEVQHVPHLFATLKAAIDRDRRPGRFMLTGSTNVLLLPKLSDSLAGRMAVVRLHPLAQCELAGTRPAFLDRLFGEGFKMRQFERLGPALHERITAGGYPAALKLPLGRRRARWYEGYLETIVQRDVRELARIASLDAVPRLLVAAAAQTARLLNVSELAAPFQLSRPTIRDYLTLLERIFLLEELPPWHANRLSRLVKTPKLHLGDTGLGCALLSADAKALREDRALLGQLLETFVFQELRRQASWHDEPHAFYHFRDRDGYEVDIVVERGARAVAGIEVKAAATVTDTDFRGLRKLKDAAGRRFAAGVVLYDGTMSVRFGEGLFAVPIRALWEAA